MPQTPERSRDQLRQDVASTQPSQHSSKDKAHKQAGSSLENPPPQLLQPVVLIS
ncbi:hypothetical protein LEMLEM_LOCUS21275, partial [Lemmus lemmus]